MPGGLSGAIHTGNVAWHSIIPSRAGSMLASRQTMARLPHRPLSAMRPSPTSLADRRHLDGVIR